jgi:hypothetical protein
MAEQLCVGALIHYTQTAVVDLARDGAVDLDLRHDDDGGVDLTLWTDLYLTDVEPRAAV